MMGDVPEPSTHHFLTRDIYTHVKWSDRDTTDNASGKSDYTQPIDRSAGRGDTIFTVNDILILDSLTINFDKKKYGLADTILAVQANFRVLDLENKVHIAQPVFSIQNNQPTPIEYAMPDLGIKLNFWKVNPETGKISVYVSEKKANKKDFIVMEAMIFPWINVLWIGCIIMVIGTFIAIRERLALGRAAKNAH